MVWAVRDEVSNTLVSLLMCLGVRPSALSKIQAVSGEERMNWFLPLIAARKTREKSSAEIIPRHTLSVISTPYPPMNLLFVVTCSVASQLRSCLRNDSACLEGLK